MLVDQVYVPKEGETLGQALTHAAMQASVIRANVHFIHEGREFIVEPSAGDLLAEKGE